MDDKLSHELSFLRFNEMDSLDMDLNPDPCINELFLIKLQICSLCESQQEFCSTQKSYQSFN